MSNKISKIISIIVFILVLAGMGYYFWPESSVVEPQEFSIDEPLSIVRNDLTQAEIDKYTKRYNDNQVILATEPTNFWALMDVAVIKKIVGDYEGAEAAWLKVIELNSGNSTAPANLADLHANFTKDYEKAELYYQDAITKSAGESFNIDFLRGYFDFALYNLEDKEKAEILLLAGIQANPKNAELPLVLASFYKDEKRISDAIIYYEKALELDPDDYVAREELEALR